MTIDELAAAAGREAIARMKDADEAHSSAALIRAGKWDDVSEVANAIAGARFALESAKQKEAEGWVLVPKEPTNEHLRAMLAVDEPATFRSHLRHPDNGPSMAKATEVKIERARAMYSALLSAGGEGQ